MKKRVLKMILTASLLVVLVLGCPVIDSMASAETDVAINSTNFPDDVFRNYIRDELDTDGNEVLDTTEISMCTSIICSYLDIYDLTGIELFYNLEILKCDSCELNSLDVSANTKLTELDCSYNSLTSLDMSKNTALIVLDCSFNNLSSLNLSNNLALEDLNCSVNNLNTLDVSKNISLAVLDCSETNLSSLDVSYNTALLELNCHDNKLSTLDISKNTSLSVLACYNNSLSSLNVNHNTALKELYCSNNNLSSLDLSNNTKLTELDCSNNSLNILVLDKHTSLINMICNNNNLSSLDISGCTGISYLNCSDNKLTSLLMDNNTALTFLDCSSNNLSSLDVSESIVLQSLSCNLNQLISLDISNNTTLTLLDCSSNNINSLDVSKNTLLVYLHCYDNNLNSLNMGANTALKFLDCSDNNLISLDVSNCTNLYSLYCYANKINNIDTKNLTKLGTIILLNTPTVNTPTKVSNGINVSWSQSIGATGYYIYRREVGDSWKMLAEVEGVDTLSYIDETTSNNKVYEYTIRGYWDIGTIYLSDYDHNGKSISLCTQTLATPILSNVSNVNGGVKISWGKVTGAAKYRAFYKTGSGTWKRIADTTSTSYTWTGAKSGTKYTFTVRCVSSDGQSYTSSYDSTGKSITYVAAPKLSSVSNVNNGVKIRWIKVTGAEKYRVFYKTGSGSWKRIADTTATSYTWTGAKSGTKYTFTVRCVSSDGKNYTSSYDSTGKSITYIAAPKLSGVSNVNGGVKITWGKVTGTAKYRVFYKTGSGSWKRIADTTSTSYIWTGAKSGTKYTFTVRCISSDGQSYTSNYDSTGKSITYVATPKLSSVRNVNGGVKITWGKVTGAAKYRVFYKTGSRGWKKLTDTTSTSYTWKGGKKGTTYSFTVRCINSTGKSYTSGYDVTGKKISY